MSNCHLVAWRSPIPLAASRLALRAPALRAATALTRPNRSAQRLPCGRHAVPTTKTVGPSANPKWSRSQRALVAICLGDDGCECGPCGSSCNFLDSRHFVMGITSADAMVRQYCLASDGNVGGHYV
jgi:hypothetical protein